MRQVSVATLLVLIATFISFTTESYTQSFRGEYPWLVAIFDKHSEGSSFHCSGSLINDRTVLTAASYLERDGFWTIDQIILQIGRYNLSDHTENDYVVPELHEIIRHPGYKIYGHNANIAIIILRTPVTFTRYIQPISLWKNSTELDDLVSRKGTVVGWSVNDKYIRKEVPYKEEISLASERDCISYNIDGTISITKETFCSGLREYTDPSFNIEGVFLLFQNGKCYLSGILRYISSTRYYDDKKTHIKRRVFTDVAKHLQWIFLSAFEATSSGHGGAQCPYLDINNLKSDISDEKDVTEFFKSHPLLERHLAPCLVSMYNTTFRATTPTPTTMASTTTESDRNDVLFTPKPVLRFNPRDYPWLVAIFQKTPQNSRFICSGSLIYETVVLTTARCLNSEVLLTIEDIMLRIDHHNWSADSENDYVVPELYEIIIHPDYNEYGEDANIAMVILKTPVTPYIRPISLWKDSTELSLIVSREGTFVRWEFVESVLHKNKYEMLIVSHEKCINYNKDVSDLITNQTFCSEPWQYETDLFNEAGEEAGVFLLFQDGEWYLRGISSYIFSDAIEDLETSIDFNYIIFIDVAKHLEWISSTLSTFETTTAVSTSTTTIRTTTTMTSTTTESFKGTRSLRGDYPWLVAIFQKTPQSSEFICSGSLINDRTVLTSARCLNRDVLLTPKDIILEVGRYNLSDHSENDYAVPELHEIIRHPGYEKLDHNANIAIIMLQTPVTFTPFIQPISLWKNSPELSLIESQNEIVVGWGKNDLGELSDVPYEDDILTVSQEECLNYNHKFSLPNQTFCSERKNETDLFTDAGALLLLQDGKWYLRGIVSASKDSDLHHDTVITDIDKHFNWVHTTMRDATMRDATTRESFKGTPSIYGDYPWLVAIFPKKTKCSEIRCSGCLISDRAVLTTARCLRKHNGDILKTTSIILHIGHYNLTDHSEDNYIIPALHKIIIHPDHWQDAECRSDANIAIIILRTSVTFTPYILPISLWRDNPKLSMIVSRNGTVVGWGVNKNFTRSDIPYEDETPIVAQQTCLKSHDDFYFKVSNRTFCAGRKDGTDLFANGGAFLLRQGEKRYLRGLRSTGISTTVNYPDLNHYSVFTDVAKHIDWIYTTLNNASTTESSNSSSLSVRGDYPWLVAIFQKTAQSSKFLCCGSLISETVVLSTARCFRKGKDNNDTLKKEDIILQIGRYNVTNQREEYITPELHKIITHPEFKGFNSYSMDNDIAIIKFRVPIKLTALIQPILLWKEKTNQVLIDSQNGTVVGWGKNEQGDYTDIPFEVNMPIVKNLKCKKYNAALSLLLTSDRTFCARSIDERGPCNGGSGGSLSLLRGGKWYLRGIVNVDLHDETTNSCDLYNYVIFTDVARHLDWIYSYLY